MSAHALREVAGRTEPAIAAHAVADPPPDRFADVVGDSDRLFTIEAVHEGYLLHYGEPRAFAGMDDDLRLLAGDALYALGLSRVAATGDLEAVAELADLISAAARAHADGDAAGAEALWAQRAERLA